VLAVLALEHVLLFIVAHADATKWTLYRLAAVFADKIFEICPCWQADDGLFFVFKRLCNLLF